MFPDGSRLHVMIPQITRRHMDQPVVRPGPYIETLSPGMAPAKASSVALFRRDGNDLMGLQQAYPAVFAQIIDVAGTPIVAGRAARLIRRGSVVAGAIAIAGGTLEQDDECVDAGIGSLSPSASA